MSFRPSFPSNSKDSNSEGVKNIEAKNVDKKAVEASETGNSASIPNPPELTGENPAQSEFSRLMLAAEALFLNVEEASTLPEALALCEGALDLYRQARTHAGSNVEHRQQVRLAVAKIYSQRGHQQRYARNYTEAIEELTQALKFNPSMSEDYYYRALSYLKKGDAAAAKADLTEYLKRGEDEYLRQAARAQLEMLIPKREDAQASLTYWRSQGTHFNSEATEAIHPRGEDTPDYATAISYYNKAIEAFNQALEAVPNDMMAKLGLLTAFKDQAACYRQISEYDLAIEDYNRALAVKANPQYVFERGEIYRAAGHRELARADFEQYLQTGPNSVLKQQASQYLAEKTSQPTNPSEA